MARSAALLVLAVTCLLITAAPRKASAITCGQVVQYLSPCIPYARGNGGSMPPACCSGVKGLNGAATNTPDRQAACNCIKSAVTNIKGLNLGLVAGIPNVCHVDIPYVISPSTDCSKVTGPPNSA